jgi:hypothetical protein
MEANPRVASITSCHCALRASSNLCKTNRPFPSIRSQLCRKLLPFSRCRRRRASISVRWCSVSASSKTCDRRRAMTCRPETCYCAIRRLKSTSRFGVKKVSLPTQVGPVALNCILFCVCSRALEHRARHCRHLQVSARLRLSRYVGFARICELTHSTLGRI